MVSCGPACTRVIDRDQNRRAPREDAQNPKHPEPDRIGMHSDTKRATPPQLEPRSLDRAVKPRPQPEPRAALGDVSLDASPAAVLDAAERTQRVISAAGGRHSSVGCQDLW